MILTELFKKKRRTGTSAAITVPVARKLCPACKRQLERWRNLEGKLFLLCGNLACKGSGMYGPFESELDAVNLESRA